MKLHWSPRSPFVRKVMVSALELGVRDQIDCVRTVAVTDKPDAPLMADNPLNKIPCMILDDGTILQDSRVICEYLDDLAGGARLFPTGAKRWDALRRQALGDGLLDLLIIWRHERNRPEKLHHTSYLDAYRLKANATFDRLAADIPARTGFDIGDLTIGCALAYADFRYSELEWRNGRARLADWFKRVAARPSFMGTPIVNDGDAR